MTERGVAEMLALFEAAYGATYTPFQTAMWERVLSDWTDKAAEAAAIRHIRGSKFAPRPAEIVALLEPPKEAVQAERQAGATLAWLQARAAIEDPYKSHLFEDRAIPLALEALGGILGLSQKESDELDTFTRKEFERIHAALVATGRAHPSGYVAGLVETVNRTKEGGLDALVDVVKIGGPDDGMVLRMLTRQTASIYQATNDEPKGAIPAHIELTE